MADFAGLHGIAPEEFEELRIALVMNGGVSLAVWIGGVANEINGVARGEGVYGRLLALAASIARVDVISGTSAGGINGALLGLAQVYGADLAPLRAVWLDRGSFDQLLRSPHERDPESLLRGNEYFFKQLREAFRKVKGSRVARRAEQVPIELTLTATLLHGQPNRIPDDFGTVIADVTHRGRFEFRRGPDVPPPDPSTGLPRDPFADERIDRWLALAARATASFPVAFEPVFCPVKADKLPPLEGFLDMHGLVNFGTSRFLLDGGILDNKPLESAINAVFRQRASGDVRRVLCYVVPFPGETAAEPADEFDKPPTLGEVAVASLVTLPRVESISAQLEAIVEHNRLVRRKRQTRVALAAEVKWEGVRPIAERLFQVYRRRRLESAADYIVVEVARGFMQESGPGAPLGRRRREWLSSFLVAPAAVPWVPDALPAVPPKPDELVYTRWSWGAFTLENIGEVMLDLLRRGLQLTPLRDIATRKAIKDFRVAAYDIIADAPLLRERDKQFWRERGAEVGKLLKDQADPAGQAEIGNRWAADALRRWEERKLPLGTSQRAVAYGPTSAALAGEAPIRSALGWLAFAMAGLIAAAAPLLSDIAAAARKRARTGVEEREADHLAALLEFLAPASDRTREAVLARLITLDVMLYAVGSQRDVRDQFVELVQISANVPTSFGGPALAIDKLAGAQIGNFAGFYRKAWRANDWMFGRLDGAERLARVILNPARFLRLYQGRATAAQLVDAIGEIAVPQPSDPDAASRPLLERLWKETRPDVAQELAFLDHVDHPVPEQLASAVAAVVNRVHLAILRDELPAIAGAVEDDLANGADATGPAAQFLREARRRVGARGLAALGEASPEVLAELFRQCHVGEERFKDQVGSDLFTKTVTRALAVVATTLASERAGLGRARRVLQALRFPMLVVDVLAQSLVRQSRTGVAVFVTALAAGGAIVGLELFTSARVPDGLASLGAIAFVGAVALLLRRSPWLLIGWLAFAILVWLGRDYLPGAVGAAIEWLERLKGSSS
jgi:patatin-related protein